MSFSLNRPKHERKDPSSSARLDHGPLCLGLACGARVALPQSPILRAEIQRCVKKVQEVNNISHKRGHFYCAQTGDISIER